MAKSQELRFQLTVPAPNSDTGVLKLYADASGILKGVRSDSSVLTIGQTYTNLVSGNFPGQLGTFVTGLQPGVTGSLGTTKTFFVVSGPSGGNWAIPAFQIT